ncbi:protein-L-isoaspartate O-methyltransferase [Desulfurococcus amylolyticus 1221n]|uniref:Protein-L-isoaspartate O-methyltransferase n=1 Tax=Desulfurococcus amylolyticus (strain DSM 18924 / JCM 16383 / VKM B-2413 / 1221n) TaxID=490899 RepID=B8D5L2_DESA1|nr:protein-L-isoaspartate O-methyltransferase [Desulfurococcus amylolyticus]ACL11393.1 protein-L-isoaspartate O-methyltransferase [Desulfurococcus amylolyticus 1221n]
MSGLEEQKRLIIEELHSLGYLRSEKVIKALLKVPRELFLPPHLREYAYVDTPLPIGFGQTISAIHMVAIMTEELDPAPGDRVLEVGTGSGYQAAVLAEIVARSGEGKKGHVYTIERIPELAEYARKRLEEAGYSSDVTVIVGDGTLGLPEKAPFDKIIVTAAAPYVPNPLIEQLAEGGRLVIPVGDVYLQRLLTVEKYGSSITKRYGIECVFVPLIGKYGWHTDSTY